VRQAAIWILTDNADYEKLAVLLESHDGFSARRSINEVGVAQAIRALDDAGIDISNTAIWHEREGTSSNLSDGDTKPWLEGLLEQRKRGRSCSLDDGRKTP